MTPNISKLKLDRMSVNGLKNPSNHNLEGETVELHSHTNLSLQEKKMIEIKQE